tara:strand:+ start:171 stop:737 length:567 start_codon:yes stop_codon:yes gene_type:complete
MANAVAEAALQGLKIGRAQEKQKQDLKIATNSRGSSQWDDMSGYGSDWPGTMKDQMDETGTDPAEIFEQLELPLDQVQRLKQLMISGALLPGESAGSSTGGLKGMTPDGVQRYLKENNITGPAADKIWKKYKGLQGGVDLPLAQVDYNKNMPQGYKDWSEQLKGIMGTKGNQDFLKELLIHTRNYPKA